MAKLLPDGPIDTLGVLDAFLAMHEHVAEAGEAGPVEGLVAATQIDHVVVVTPGEAATVGELARVLVAPVATVPVVVHPTGPLPAFVTSQSLVIVASLDDDGHALAALRASTGRHAHVVAIAPHGSALADAAAEVGAAHVATAVGVPVARAGVAALVVHVLSVLEQLGQYSGVTSAVAASVTQLEARRTELTGGRRSPAARLAARIGRTLPIVYGADELTGVAARHWKRQVNLNAKAASFAASLPDLAGDEIAGWGQHGDMTRQVFTLVTLRHDHESDDAIEAMAVVEELVDEVVHERHEVRAAGDGSLAQALDLVFQGDITTWHLAQQLEIDPGPTAATSAVWSNP